LRVYRVFHRRHAATAFSGDGARRFGGRWNSPGVAMVYTSSSFALALLELMVNARRGRTPPGMVYCIVDVPDGVRIDAIRETTLPPCWFAYPAPHELQSIGDQWARRGRSVGLIVPSAIVRIENNVLLNPSHAEFARLSIGEPQEFPIDERFPR
jgi:RES domain-containing protein